MFFSSGIPCGALPPIHNPKRYSSCVKLDRCQLNIRLFIKKSRLLLRRFPSRYVHDTYADPAGNVRKTVKVRLDGRKSSWGVGGCWIRLKTSPRVHARTHIHKHSQDGSREPFNTHLSAPVWSVRAEPLQGLSNTASPLAPPKLNARLRSRGTTSLWILLQLAALFQTSLEFLPDFEQDWILNLKKKTKKKLYIYLFFFKSDSRPSSWPMQIWQKCPLSY